MEGRKPASGASSSSSSLSSDLFGSKDSATANSSSGGVFGSVFSPASMGLGVNSSRSDALGTWRRQNPDQAWNGKPTLADKNPQSGERHSILNKDGGSMFHDETVEPCFLSSSLYYGGRDICNHSPNTRASGTAPIFKKDGGDDDASNSNSASRGNWWQGSLYY